EGHHLLPEFTALENVMMPLLIAQSSSGKDRVSSFPSRKMKQIREKIEEESLRILTEVGLKDRINHSPSELSVGEQQRVAVARALINSPQAILADEPTGNLDKKTGDSVFELLLELNQERGKVLVIVTHNEVLVERIASLHSGKIIHLHDGKIIN
nr:ATP-binding cassette domain-containing protein [Bacillota bacterium]